PRPSVAWKRVHTFRKYRSAHSTPLIPNRTGLADPISRSRLLRSPREYKTMATDAQVAANRANAQHSTGPTSETGKANSSKNALKNGLFTKHHVILPGEDQSQYEALLECVQAEFQPRTPAERHLVREMAESQWRLARVGRYEQEALAEAGPNPDVNLLL